MNNIYIEIGKLIEAAQAAEKSKEKAIKDIAYHNEVIKRLQVEVAAFSEKSEICIKEAQVLSEKNNIPFIYNPSITNEDEDDEEYYYSSEEEDEEYYNSSC